MDGRREVGPHREHLLVLGARLLEAPGLVRGLGFSAAAFRKPARAGLLEGDLDERIRTDSPGSRTAIIFVS
jgi:hypothetical protein